MARRKLETMEKDARAADLYRRGLSYRQIAAQMGWRSPNAAMQAVRRAVADSVSSPLAVAEAKQLMLDRLQDYRRVLWRIATTTHYATTAAGVAFITDETGAERPLVDDGPVKAAVDGLLKCDEREAKLLGLDAPVRHEVRNIDAIDARLLDLADQMGSVGQGNPAQVPGEA